MGSITSHALLLSIPLKQIIFRQLKVICACLQLTMWLLMMANTEPHILVTQGNVLPGCREVPS